MTSNTSHLLARLEAHGAEFLTFFGDSKSKWRKGNNETDDKPSVDEYDVDEQWTGFTSEIESEDDVQNDHGKISSTSRSPQVVAFSESTSRKGKLPSRLFMSSKVSELNRDPTNSSQDVCDEGEQRQDMSNLQNDALLHRLVHSKLLSGSLNPELNMTPAQQRKALAGRVLELAGESKLGKGEAIVRQSEKNRAAKKVREGMMSKQKEREKRRLEEEKNAGNYHPLLKKLFTQSGSGGKSRKRIRGMKMGVGRFSGGVLNITPKELSSTQSTRSSSDRSRKRAKR